MKRMLILIAALALMLGAFTSYGSAMTARPVAQDDPAKKEAEGLYREWYTAYQAKDYPKAISLAKTYLEKFPSGERAGYFKDWLESTFILRILFGEAAKAKNRAETLTIGKKIIAKSDVKEEDKLQYLLFMADDLIKNELQATPPSYAHAAEITDFSQQIIALLQAGKTPGNPPPAGFNAKALTAYFYQSMANIEEVNNKNNDKALELYSKAIEADPTNARTVIISAFRCGDIHYKRYGAAAEEFRKFPDADQVAASDNKPEAKPEVKAAFEKLNKEADAVIDCWARYLALTASDTSQGRAQVDQAVKDLYKFRHNDSLDGLQQLIDKYKPGASTTPATPPAQPNPATAKPPSN